MMNFVKVCCTILAVSVALTGCSTTKGWFGKRDNGSLKYRDSQLLAPVQLPVNQATLPFTPLYPTPQVGQNTLNLTNDAQKQYRLPKPPVVIHTQQK